MFCCVLFCYVLPPRLDKSRQRDPVRPIHACSMLLHCVVGTESGIFPITQFAPCAAPEVPCQCSEYRDPNRLGPGPGALVPPGRVEAAGCRSQSWVSDLDRASRESTVAPPARTHDAANCAVVALWRVPRCCSRPKYCLIDEPGLRDFLSVPSAVPLDLGASIPSRTLALTTTSPIQSACAAMLHEPKQAGCWPNCSSQARGGLTNWHGRWRSSAHLITYLGSNVR